MEATTRESLRTGRSRATVSATTPSMGTPTLASSWTGSSKGRASWTTGMVLYTRETGSGTNDKVGRNIQFLSAKHIAIWQSPSILVFFGYYVVLDPALLCFQFGCGSVAVPMVLTLLWRRPLFGYGTGVVCNGIGTPHYHCYGSNLVASVGFHIGT